MVYYIVETVGKKSRLLGDACKKFNKIVEQSPRSRRLSGLGWIPETYYGCVAQLGERHPVTVEVAGSKPVTVANFISSQIETV